MFAALIRIFHKNLLTHSQASGICVTQIKPESDKLHLQCRLEYPVGRRLRQRPIYQDTAQLSVVSLTTLLKIPALFPLLGKV
jgi:hypothetical protein